MKKITLFLLAASVLSGCSAPIQQNTFSQQNPLSPAMQADYDKPLYCNSPDECKVMWKRAFQFVSLNAGYEIETANAALIRTKFACFNSGYQCKPDSSLSMQITKSPRGEGRYQILTGAKCHKANCVPNVYETIWRAKLFIREGKE